MPLVSVIVPAFEPGPRLARALDSILGQTMADLEVIVVDDGSTEDLAWVARHTDPRVRYVRQDNRGVSMARNVGVRLASSGLVAFLDQDDEWLPRKLEVQVPALAAVPDAAFCCTAFTWVSPTGTTDSRLDPVTYHGLLSTETVLLSSILIPRDRLLDAGGFDPFLAQAQDWDLALRLLMDGAPAVLVPDRLVRYHLHDANASGDYRRAAAERYAVLDRHTDQARRRGDGATLAVIAAGRSRTGELFAHQAVDAARRALRERAFGAAAGHVATAGRLDSAVLALALRQTVSTRAARLRRR